MTYLNVKTGGIYVDCTYGGGGHAAAILERIGPDGCLVVLDRDSDAIDRAREAARQDDRIYPVHAPFSRIDEAAKARDVFGDVDGILADLGTSMFQLKDPDRGFSFMEDGPLDMRMDSSSGLTAADVLNRYPEQELVRIFREYGEERHARRIAREVVEVRRQNPFASTRQFAGLIEGLASGKRDRIHPATRCFQALRIEVNHELEELERLLNSAWQTLKTGGRLVIISFHSLEDRMVKQFFRKLARSCICPDELPRCECGGNNAQALILTRKVVRPSEAEAAGNRAARSSRLRAAQKIREQIA